MNTSLVDALAQAVLSLSPEERRLLYDRVFNQPSWRETRQSLANLHTQILLEREGSPLDLDVVDQIHQMRDERTEHLMQICSPEGHGY